MKFDEAKEKLVLLVAIVALVKLIVHGLTLADSLGVLFMGALLHAHTIVSYVYPKRPDLYLDVSELKGSLDVLITRIEALEHDTTALKFGASRR